jgi:hypothetical protein
MSWTGERAIQMFATRSPNGLPQTSLESFASGCDLFRCQPPALWQMLVSIDNCVCTSETWAEQSWELKFCQRVTEFSCSVNDAIFHKPTHGYYAWAAVLPTATSKHWVSFYTFHLTQFACIFIWSEVTQFLHRPCSFQTPCIILTSSNWLQSRSFIIKIQYNFLCRHSS